MLFSAFISRSFIFVSVPNPHQMCTSDGHAAPACLRRYFGCLLNAGNKHGHAKKTHKSKHNMPLLIDAAASITAGFCQSHFLCDLYTRCYVWFIILQYTITRDTAHFLQLALPEMYRYDIIYHTLSIFAKQALDNSITTHKSRQYLTRSAAKIHTETAVSWLKMPHIAQFGRKCRFRFCGHTRVP